MNICSMVVHARPERLDNVRGTLSAMPGVEVHAESDAGKLVVTIENDDRMALTETLMGMNNVEGVLSAALVYEYNEQQDSSEEVSQ